MSDHPITGNWREEKIAREVFERFGFVYPEPSKHQVKPPRYKRAFVHDPMAGVSLKSSPLGFKYLYHPDHA